MSPAAGTRLGPDDIVAPIGAGGMGEVFRARDRKLDRDVAIKVLASHLSSDPDALARFSGGVMGIGAYDIAAHAVRKVYDGQAYRWEFPWLEDGRRVLFASEGAISLLDVDSRKTQRVVSGILVGYGPVLSPDSRTMFVGVRTQQADVWLVELMAKKR